MTTTRFRAPWFKEWAESLLADPAIRDMDLDELGLIALARWHYWRAECAGLPADPRRLCREIGRDPRTLVPRLRDALLTQFRPDPDDAERLICPDLDEQFEALIRRRAKESEAGRRGRALQLARGTPESKSGGSPTSEIPGHPRAEVDKEKEKTMAAINIEETMTMKTPKSENPAHQEQHNGSGLDGWISRTGFQREQGENQFEFRRRASVAFAKSRQVEQREPLDMRDPDHMAA